MTSTRSHRQPIRLSLVAWTIGSLMVTATGASAQSQERGLYVSVVDHSGAPVTDLATREFVVKEDGVAREVLRSGPATDPLQIALVVDNSQAASTDIPDLREALRTFVAALAGTNEMAIIATADRPTILVDYTTRPADLEKGIGRIFSQPGSGAYLLESIIEVSRGIQKRDAPRPVLLIVTTEGPEFSDLHYDYVLDALEKSGAAMHAVVLTSPDADISSDRALTRSIVLNRGTESSGGRQEHVLTSQNLTATLTEIAAEIANQYRIVYSRPESLIPPKKTEVGVTRPTLTARGTPVRTAAGGR